MNVPATTGSMWLELEQQGVITKRALHLPAGISLDQLHGIGAYTLEKREQGRFVMGDLLLYTTNVYGDEATEELKEWLVENFEVAERTLWNQESVCRRVRPEVRRDELTFGHHDVVAKFIPSVQKQLLKLAVENRWSVQRLRDEVHGPKVLPPAVNGNLPDVVRDALAGAREMMDGWLISRDSFVRLRAALGEDIG